MEYPVILIGECEDGGLAVETLEDTNVAEVCEMLAGAIGVFYQVAANNEPDTPPFKVLWDSLEKYARDAADTVLMGNYVEEEMN